MIEQDRAKHAADRVSKIDGRNLEEYSKQAAKLPAMLMGVGLGQTVAFLGSKKEAVPALLLEHLSGWLRSDLAPIGWAEGASADLQSRLAECDTATYYQALGEALEYAGWLKRLSKARPRERQGGDERRQ